MSIMDNPDTPSAQKSGVARADFWILAGLGLLCILSVVAFVAYGWLIPDSVRGGPSWGGISQELPPSGWKLAMDETFPLGNPNHWQMEAAGYETRVKASMDASAYRWEFMSGDPWILTDEPLRAPKATDVYVTVDVEADITEGSGIAYGLTFRAINRGDRYRFLITDFGTFVVTADIAGEPSQLFKPETSDAIHPTGSNQLAVLARGDNLAFFINGRLVRRITDDQIASGKSGLCGQTFDERVMGTLTFRNFKIYTP